MAVSIGEAVLTIGLDDARLKKGMKGIGAALKRNARAIGLGMTAVGGSILAIGVTSVKAFADMGDEIHKMSLRTGISTESLSRLKFAAELGGASLNDIEKATKKMAATLLGAEQGLKTNIDALEELGLTLEDFQGLNPEEAFFKMSEGIASIDDPLRRSAVSAIVFGKAGTQLLPMLADGAEGIKSVMEQADKFAVVMDAEAAEAAAELTDQMTKLKGGFQKVQAEIAGKLIPILIPLIDKIVEAIANVSAWMEANPALTKTIIIIVGAIGGLLTVLGPIVLMIPTIAAALPILAGAFTFLLGPVGLVIAAIVGLIAIGVLLVKNWDKIKLFFVGVWATIKDIFFSNINSIIGMINKLIGIINKIPGVNIGKIGAFGDEPKAFAHGGLITEPTLLSSLRTGRPIGVAGEAGVERISPGGGGDITNNFAIEQMIVREEADIPRIARELFNLQQARVRGVGGA